MRKIRGRNEVTPIGRDATDSDELSSLAGERFCDDADASIGRDHNVEGPSRYGGIESLAKCGSA